MSLLIVDAKMLHSGLYSHLLNQPLLIRQIRGKTNKFNKVDYFCLVNGLPNGFLKLSEKLVVDNDIVAGSTITITKVLKKSFEKDHKTIEYYVMVLL